MKITVDGEFFYDEKINNNGELVGVLVARENSGFYCWHNFVLYHPEVSTILTVT